MSNIKDSEFLDLKLNELKQCFTEEEEACEDGIDKREKSDNGELMLIDFLYLLENF